MTKTLNWLRGLPVEYAGTFCTSLITGVFLSAVVFLITLGADTAHPDTYWHGVVPLTVHLSRLDRYISQDSPVAGIMVQILYGLLFVALLVLRAVLFFCTGIAAGFILFAFPFCPVVALHKYAKYGPRDRVPA